MQQAVVGDHFLSFFQWYSSRNMENKCFVDTLICDVPTFEYIYFFLLEFDGNILMSKRQTTLCGRMTYLT